jgi:uncharacterized Ntn-hydrolase superfamily protein
VTFSIVARDEQTGDLGVAVASKFLAVGSIVPWAQAGIGAVATQATANPALGPDGLRRLGEGLSARETVEWLTGRDAGRAERQIGIVDANGEAASFTGRACFAWAGGTSAPNFAAQGNILAGPEVIGSLVAAFAASRDPLPERLLAALRAGQAAGGDRRGQESAALLVVRASGGYGGTSDRWVDLRVDDHEGPIEELGRLLALHRLYLTRPEVADLVPVDEPLALELRTLLERTGSAPNRDNGAVYARMWPDEAPPLDASASVGEARPFPDAWDARWQRALVDWMGVENVEERIAAPGWLDPGVLQFLRRRAGSARPDARMGGTDPPRS